ncbi:hypothetical protein [Endozoicomonas sp. SCSIO W0465]|uniref:hypothetical protein n=1 Tax=Endozoicomonas sp. SCSIO W0465 TaxID=2918516 RepID=UPI0020753C1D|nr:hypothetical protein [Endozoicomonas sp. SCSIO W0465]USE38038.1 hypothetical protein MJO57_07630 [Endozoicomonas sp. SCSIO W0465]
MTTTNKTATKKTTTKKQQGEKPMKTKKSKSEKFVEIANIRMVKTLRLIDRVGALADKSRYDYTDEQADKIKEALQSALAELVNKFEHGEKEEKPVFRI